MHRPTSTFRRALCAAAVLALTPALAAAQRQCAAGETTLGVGDPRLASYTPPAADTVDMWIEQDTTVQPIGVYTQHVSRVEHDGQPAWLVVQSTAMQGREMVDSVTVRAGTFAPLRHVAATPMYSADVRFGGGKAVGTRSANGQSQAVDAAVGAGAFDYSVVSLVLGAVPLCEGVTARLETHDITRGPVPVTVRVAAPETVTLRGRTFDVWPVDVDMGMGTSRLYVDRATGREVGWMVRFPDGRAMKGANRVHGGHAHH